jgi:glycine/D-amino acid oxidase-like deaminating enzyme
MAAKRRVGVIGAGMVGVTAASFLQRDGHEVFVLDPAAPGEGASFGNAGQFNGSSVVPMSLPGTLPKVPGWLADPLGPLSIRWRHLPALAPWLIRFVRAGRLDRVERTARALRALLEPSIETLLPLLKEAGAEDLLHRAGNLVVYRSRESYRKDRLAWRLRRDNGVPFEELDADELRQLEPSLSRDYAFGVLLRENGHASNPHRLVNRLAETVLANGGRLVRASAVGFEFDGGRLRGIRTETGEVLPADAAVLCAGARSGPLVRQLGDAVPLETERGYHAMIRDPEAVPRLAVTEAEAKFAATPMEEGLRLAGTVELAGLAAAPDWRRARRLLELGRRLFPALRENYPEERVSFWMGHRPSTPDSLPVIGRSRRSADIFYAFGHGHVGMAGSPMTGRLIADLVGGRPPGIDPSPYRADRFG